MHRTRHVRLPSGIRLSIAEQGRPQDGPSILLLPGPTDSWRSYEPVLAHLPESMHAIAVSSRGHGDSDKPDDGYAVPDLAGDVLALADELELDRLVLVGHSGSCLTVRSVAIAHPARVGGVLLEASPLSLAGDARLAGFVERLRDGQLDPQDPDFVRAFVADTSSGSLPEELLGMLVEEVRKVPAALWVRIFGKLLAYDDTPSLGSLEAPALLVWGERDPLVDRRTQELLADLLPDAILVTYPGIGHTPRWELPERFAADLVRFVGQRSVRA